MPPGSVWVLQESLTMDKFIPMQACELCPDRAGDSGCGQSWVRTQLAGLTQHGRSQARHSPNTPLWGPCPGDSVPRCLPQICSF